MDPRVPAEELDELLENSSWVRNLALRLLVDTDQAEDVVQEVWLTALRQPPRKRQALRAWLKQVASNVARRRNRSEARRRTREERRVPDPDVVPPDVVVERMEMQQRVAGAVVRLPEPYRNAIYLRYYVGLPHSEIATQLSIPESTVRTHVSRALDLLRDRLGDELDSREGGWRGAVVLAFLPECRHLVAAGAAPGGAVSASSGLASRFGRATSVAIPVLAVVVLLLVLASRQDNSMTSETVPAHIAAPLPRTRDVAPDTASTVVATRDSSTALPSAAQPLTVDPPPEAAEEPTVAQHRLVVVDADGTPIVGAEVEWFETGTADPVQVAVTDAQGEVTVARDTMTRSALRVTADGFVEYHEPTILRELGPATPYRVELEETFLGIVRVLYPNGQPAQFAAVEVRGDPDTSPRAKPQSVETDRKGEARFWFRYHDTEIRLAVSGFATVAVPAQRPTTEVLLQPGRDVTGRIVDADGANLECTVILSTPVTRPSGTLVVTDRDGYFSMGSLQPHEPVSISVYPSGRPPFKTEGTPPPEGVWDIEVPQSLRVEGWVNAADENLGGTVVFVTTAQSSPRPPRHGGIPSIVSELRATRYHRARSRLVPLRRTAPDEEGHFAIDYLLAAGEPAYLLIHHPTLVNRVVALDKESKELHVAVERGQQLKGRVVSPSGEPLPGVLLHLGEKWSNDVESVLGRARTDSDGSFTFVGVPTETHQHLEGTDAASEIHRSEVFITAFAPDLLLSGNGQTLADSTIPDSFVVEEPGPIHLVATDRGQVVDLGIELRDVDRAPVTRWVPALLLTNSSFLHGVVGPRDRGFAFVGEHPIDIDRTALALFLMPAHASWCHVALGTTPRGVQLEPSDETDQRVYLGKEAASRTILISLSVDDGPPVAWLPIGTATAGGELILPPLPDGTYSLILGPTGDSPGARASAPTSPPRPIFGELAIRRGGAEFLDR